MGFNKLNSFSSVLLLAMIACASINSAVARPHISPFCKNAHKIKTLCNNMIHGATTYKAALGNAINNTLGLAKDLQLKNKMIAQAVVSQSPAAKKSLQGTCKESFETVIDMLVEAKVALQAGDNATVKTKLSSILETECEDELANFGATFPLANLTKQLNKKVSICLAIAAAHNGGA